jgi:hypothetical protein
MVSNLRINTADNMFKIYEFFRWIFVKVNLSVGFMTSFSPIFS